MTLEKKLESLIHVGDVCVIVQRDMYQKIQKHYNLTPKQMRNEWLQYQINHYLKYKDQKLYIE